MKVELAPGKYVLAVSGGVDSMSLLHILHQKEGVDLVVAHFNHGIRSDSILDEKLVQEVAAEYGLEFAGARGYLGPSTGEDAARRARYDFLKGVMAQAGAKAIVTAHHQDDMIETALINLTRGTGRRGLSAIADSAVIRPLLGVSKAEILNYATENKLRWREDSTNSDDTYLRNRFRNGLSKADLAQKHKLVQSLNTITRLNRELDGEIANLSQVFMKSELIDRSKFSQLPQAVGQELVMYWLREAGIRDYDRRVVERLSVALKTARAGTKHETSGPKRLVINRKFAHFTTTD